MYNFNYLILMSFLLLCSALSWAGLPTARTVGPFYASDNQATPYLQLGDLLTHFQIVTLDTTEISSIQRQINSRHVKLDFSQLPDENSHSVGEGWYRIAMVAGKSMVFSWTYAGNRRPRWFAARLVQAKLQTASSQTQLWQAVTPRHSQYENWEVKEVKVEIEILNPGDDSQSILYRFRLMSDQKMRISEPQSVENQEENIEK